MWSPIVVEPNRFVYSTSGLLPVEESSSEAVLLFQNPVQSLCNRIFSTVVYLRHAHWKMTFLQAPDVLVAAILASTIRVMNRVFVVWQIFDSLVQCLERFLSSEAFGTVVTNNLVGMQVRDQCQVFEIFPGPDVGDIADPDLVWIRGFELRD